MSEKITDSGLKFEDLNVGTGDLAMAGSRVSVHYTGWLLEVTNSIPHWIATSLLLLPWVRVW